MAKANRPQRLNKQNRKGLTMYANSHKAARIRRKDKAKLVLDRGEPNIISILGLKEYNNNKTDFDSYDRVVKIWIGQTMAIIGYK